MENCFHYDLCYRLSVSILSIRYKGEIESTMTKQYTYYYVPSGNSFVYYTSERMISYNLMLCLKYDIIAQTSPISMSIV